MAEFVLVAEFNQSQGALLQVQYPYQVLSDENLADYMIPEGLHARKEDSTLFLVRRQGLVSPQPRTTLDMHPEFSRLVRVRHQVNVLLFDSKHHEWAQFSVVDGKGCLLSLVQARESLWVIDIKQFNATILTIPIHADLQYTALEHDFASLYTEDGHAVGFQFLSSTQEQLEQLLTFGGADTHSSEEDEPPHVSPSLLYCYSVAKTKHDATVERGAVTMAVALCSSSPYVTLFQTLLNRALDAALESRGEAVSELAREVYHAVNQVNFRTLPMYSAAERRVFRFMGKRAEPTVPLQQTLSVSFRGESFTLSVNLIQEPSEVIPGSLLSLLRRFKEEFMQIYDALFTGKRIILIGEETPAWEVCSATNSCLLALSPPFEGLAEGHWHPYSPLTNLNFLNKSFFIAGVSNPVFKQRENWWDLCIDWTAGRVLSKQPYSQQPHYGSDMTFVRRLLQAIEANAMGEEEVRQQFYDYTQYIADLALAKGFLQNSSRRVQKMLSDHSARIEKWEQSQVYVLSQSTLTGKYEESPSLAIRQLLTRLRVGMLDNSLDDQEAKKLYFEVDTLLCTDKDCMELLATLPNQGDLRCFTWGLFRQSKSLQDCTMSILLKLEENEVGKVLLAALSEEEREKFRSLKASKIR